MARLGTSDNRTRVSRIISEPWFWLLLIVLVAVGARAVAMGSRLTGDDAYSWYVSSAPNASAFLHRLAASENTPPLSYLLLMVLPGSQPYWLRAPAVLFGVLLCVVTFVAADRALGRRVALLAALAVAVAPYLITYSDVARGFMLADLALMVAATALIRLGERETTRTWAVFVVAGVVAVYAEYYSAICIVAMMLASVWIGRPRRSRVVAVGGLTLATLLAWLPEFMRGQQQVGRTKFSPMGATPSLRAIRDLWVTLAFGEHGGTGSSVGRWLLFCVLVALAIGGAVALRRRWQQDPGPEQRILQFLSATAVLSVIGFALVAVVGVDVFTQRYLTVLVPIAAIILAAALVLSERPWVVPVAAVALAGLGLANTGRRVGAEFQPDLTPVRAAALSLHPRTVLTNTPLVLYYLPQLRPELDRPYNLGPGLQQSCQRPCLVIDDTRVPGGMPRRVLPQRAIGPFILTLEK